MATQLDRPHSSAAWLRDALHGLVLAISNILAIVIAFALWVLLNRPAPQFVVQGALAALLTLALFAAWMWLVQRLPVGELAWHDRRDAMTTYVSALVWAPLLFVPLHLLTQGYLTAIGNIVALWLFQVPVNLAAVWLAGRVSSRRTTE